MITDLVILSVGILNSVWSIQERIWRRPILDIVLRMPLTFAKSRDVCCKMAPFWTDYSLVIRGQSARHDFYERLKYTESWPPTITFAHARSPFAIPDD